MNKQHSVVVTNGDKAIREAIKVVFPYAAYRLCAHLKKIPLRTSRTLNSVRPLRNAYMRILTMMSLRSISMQWLKSLNCMRIIG